MIQVLSDYYRTAEVPLLVCPPEAERGKPGFFRYYKNLICFGQNSTGVADDVKSSSLFDASSQARIVDGEIHLPFDISSVIDTLRMEHYVECLNGGGGKSARNEFVHKSYYFIREILPVWVRRHLQRAYFKDWQDLPFPNWPVDITVDLLHEEFLRLAMLARGCKRVPFIWFWPNGASSCLVLTHDVETEAGRDFAPTLMDLDRSHGFHASFQVIPERRYEIPDSFISEIRERGFEFNVHDLNHDGHLYAEKQLFLERARKINGYVAKYGALGFRSGAMYRNQEWFDAFDFSYDMSVPNVAHLEPQRGGCCTVMPYFVGKILELPLTTIQDYTIFNILNDYSIDLWKQQITLIQRKNGLLSFNTHPDYLIDRKCRTVYESLLAYLQLIVARDNIWKTLPREVNCWWRARSQMNLVQDGDGFRIEGPESERASIAYANLDGDKIVYNLG